MLAKIAYFLILGKPVIFYLGIITFLLLLSTAMVGFLNRRGYNIISFKWHPRLALATIIMAIIHGLLGISAYFNF